MSTFLNDRSLYDEYQNRFRKDSVPKYQPMKKVNHEKMKREVEDREDKFLKVLNNEESRQSDKPNGRKRPITSTQPSKIKNRQIVDYAEESDEETTQTFKTYEDYSRKEYRFNKDLNTSDNQEGDQSGEIDDVIDFMNSEPKQETGENYGFPIRQPRQEVKKEEKVQEQEYDYLDYQNNIDNLKKITEEQAKFDYLETDLDSWFSKFNSLLGKTNPKSSNEIGFDDTFKRQTQNPAPVYKPSPVTQEKDIYEEFGLPKLPPAIPVLQSQNYQPKYQRKHYSKFSPKNLINLPWTPYNP